MNPLIPLSIDVPDIAGNYFRGQQANALQGEQQNKEALRNALQQYGAAASQGDRNALAELAKYDPTLVSGLQNDAQQRTASQHGMAVDDQRLAMEQQRTQAAMAEHAAAMTDIQRTKAKAIVDEVAAMSSVIQSEKEWNETFGGDPRPEFRKFKGQWNKRSIIRAQALGAAEALAPPDPSSSPIGKLADDLNAGRITQEQYDQGVAKMGGTTINIGAQQAAAQGQREQTADIVGEDIKRTKKVVSDSWLPTTGAVGEFLSSVGGTGAHDVSELLQTIKSNVAFDKLQQMRAASPTGGALGQVSDAENKLLQSTLGSLEQSQSKAQFIANLDRLAKIYDQVINGPAGGGARGGQRKTKSGIVWEPAGPQ